MATNGHGKTAAEIEREIDMQRARVENTIDELQHRLSPGQLVDELLSYTKGGGGEFISGLQRSVTSNPLPVALLGVSLAWLIGRPAEDDEAARARRYMDNPRNYRDDRDYRDDRSEMHPLATITGSGLKRIGNIADDRGRHYSEFADDTGKRWRALADKSGNRVGDFMDDAGNHFRGFADEAGNQIKHFRDEAGNLLDEAAGWASHTFDQARHAFHDARETVMDQSRRLSGKAQDTGDRLMHEAERLNRTVMNQFRDQPLIGGALAFAVGAALAAALPRTQQEDQLLGEAADSIKGKAAGEAQRLYQQGKEQAEHIYGQVVDKAADLHDQAKSGLEDAARVVSDTIDRH